jgi:hypothetical protein
MKQIAQAMFHHGASRILNFGRQKMKMYKSQVVGAVGTFALLAGMLSAAVAAPKVAAPKGTVHKVAAKTTSHATTHKMAAHKTAAHKTMVKSSQVTGTVTSVKGDSLTIKPALKKMGISRTITVPRSAKVWIGGKSGKLSQIKDGQKVTVMMNGARVTSVRAAVAAGLHKATAHKTATRKTITHKTAAPKSAILKPATHKAHA